jgi:hypothetical protein
MTIPIDKVVLSSDSSPKFINFWPIAALSWQKIMGVEATLAYVVRSKRDEKLIPKLSQYGEVSPVYSSSKVPAPNQGKMARWFVASQYKNAIVTVDDIDSIFLKPNYLENKLNLLDREKLLGIGSEVYSGRDLGKFPATNLTGSGNLFAGLFRYRENMSFDMFLNQFVSIQKIDGKENPFNQPNKFSDESLIRAIAVPGQIKVIPRNLNEQTDWLDRNNWPTDWSSHTLQDIQIVNFPRPLFLHQKEVKPITQIFYSGDYPWIKTKMLWRLKAEFFS